MQVKLKSVFKNAVKILYPIAPIADLSRLPGKYFTFPTLLICGK